MVSAQLQADEQGTSVVGADLMQVSPVTVMMPLFKLVGVRTQERGE